MEAEMNDMMQTAIWLFYLLFYAITFTFSPSYSSVVE